MHASDFGLYEFPVNKYEQISTVAWCSYQRESTVNRLKNSSIKKSLIKCFKGINKPRINSLKKIIGIMYG